MNLSLWILLMLAVYYGLLLLVSALTGKRRDNDAFFLGNRQSPWYIVAFGMIGNSVSGVSFISVPGMVQENHFLYMQTVVGFFFGYLLIAHVLLPVYYRLKSASIYEYLLNRFGQNAYKTGAWYFLLAKSTGAAAKMYVIVLVLQTVVFDQLNLPFAFTAMLLMGMIWLYTQKSGIRTLVWTDALQTLFMIIALIGLLLEFKQSIGLNLKELSQYFQTSPYTQWIEWSDWNSKQHVLKQFISGIFIALVMTGLDQDMIQKNRSIKSLKDSQKNMRWYGFGFIPLNFLFLTLGVLLLLYAGKYQLTLPGKADAILPFLATHTGVNPIIGILFALGIVSATFSSADSSLTALTTSYCVDIAGKPDQVNYRKKVHLLFAVIIVLILMVFHTINHPSLIVVIYTLVSYTYGPLLGLFAFGLLTKRKATDRWVPLIAIASPIICWLLQLATTRWLHYSFGYELLMLNGLITFTGLWISSSTKHPWK